MTIAWTSPEPPQEAPALIGRIRPPAQILAWDGLNAEQVNKSLAQVVLVDGRLRPEEAAALIRKIGANTEARLFMVIDEGGLGTFSWDCGADDFLLASASEAELQARLAKVAGDLADLDTIRRRDLVIIPDRFEVRVHGHPVDLTYKEFELLRFLAGSPGRVFSRGILLREVWGYDYYGGTRTVDVHVRRLRAKLGPDASHVIETVRNVGYRFGD